jgi:hypothetical protein
MIGDQHGEHWLTPTGNNSGAGGAPGPTYAGTRAFANTHYPTTIGAHQKTTPEIRAGEIVAWRAWARKRGTKYLTSVHMSDHIWMPGAVNSCDFERRRGFPLRDLGFHAFKDITRAEAEYWGYSQYNYDMFYGSVLLWGRVFEHEWGYRAEYAKIKSIDSMTMGHDSIFDRPVFLVKTRARHRLRKIRRLYGV